MYHITSTSDVYTSFLHTTYPAPKPISQTHSYKFLQHSLVMCGSGPQVMYQDSAPHWKRYVLLAAIRHGWWPLSRPSASSHGWRWWPRWLSSRGCWSPQVPKSADGLMASANSEAVHNKTKVGIFIESKICILLCIYITYIIYIAYVYSYTINTIFQELLTSPFVWGRMLHSQILPNHVDANIVSSWTESVGASIGLVSRMFISVEEGILDERKPVPVKHQRSTLSQLLCVNPSHCVFDRGPCHACWNVVSHLWGMLAKDQWIHTSGCTSFRTETKKWLMLESILCFDRKKATCPDLPYKNHMGLFFNAWWPPFSTLCPRSLYCGDPRLEAQKMWYHQSQHLPVTNHLRHRWMDTINSIPQIVHLHHFCLSVCILLVRNLIQTDYPKLWSL